MPTRPFAVIVLAAGGGTRMKSSLPKVLHQVVGRSLVGHVIAATQALSPEHLVVVVGHGREQVSAHVRELVADAVITVQEEQNGTGHAVRVTLEQMASQGIVPQADSGPILVITGDTPLLTGQTLIDLAGPGQQGTAVRVLTARVPDPTGYGRVVRADDASVVAIVEHRDADAAVLEIDEINSGMYAFDPAFLGQALQQVTTDNAQGEEYLTDVLGIAVNEGRRVSAVPVGDHEELLGVNDRSQLATAETILRDRINTAWMKAGVTMVDPARTYVDADVELAPDVRLEPGCILRRATVIASGAVIGPDTTLVDTEVGPGAEVRRSEATLAVIGRNAVVGPFSYLRPNAQLADNSKAGAFVEIKNSVVGEGSKVPHLSYVGDAEIGPNSNIGAATVVVNYDGVKKHRTVVGRDVRVGSDTMLVAPVMIGDGAYTAAGSVITEDVPPGALAIGRGRQRNVDDWVLVNRPDTAAAEAAVAAQRGDGPQDA